MSNLWRYCMALLIVMFMTISACQSERSHPPVSQFEHLPTSSAEIAPNTDAPAVFPAQVSTELPTFAATDLAARSSVSSATKNSTQEISRDMIGKVSLERTVKRINMLTGEEPLCLEANCESINSRETGSKGLSRAQLYVHDELLTLGYSVEYRNWSRGNYSDRNIVARKLGVIYPEEEIYLVAHLDGMRPGLLSVRPAADDNASGVADLLELASILADYSFKRTVVLFFSTGEEQGTLGVKAFLNDLSPEALRSIKSVINVDMVGYDANQDRVMEIWHAGQPSSVALAQYFRDTIRAYDLDLQPRLAEGCG